MNNDALYDEEAVLEDRIEAIKKSSPGEILGMILGLEALLICQDHAIKHVKKKKKRSKKK